MTRLRLEWKIGGATLILGERTLIMGVLNVTPDSFSDGGRYLDPDLAYARALEMEDQGADMIDIGAESTRPGSERVSEAEELRRLVPVLKRLKDKLSIPICVDTYKAAVAAKAIEHGARIINDPSGLTWEPDLAKVVAEAGVGLVINHMRGKPENWATLPPLRDVVATVTSELSAAAHRARQAGVSRNRIVVDPGLGFGKRKEQNSEILGRLAEIRARVEQPVLIGVSRKSFLAQPDSRDTEFATAAAVALAVVHGAAVVRVHDVVAMRAALSVADAVLDSLPEPAEAEPRRKKSAGARREHVEDEAENQTRTSVWRPKPAEGEQAPRDPGRRNQPLVTRPPASRQRMDSDRRPAPDQARPARKADEQQGDSGAERGRYRGPRPAEREQDGRSQGWAPPPRGGKGGERGGQQRYQSGGESRGREGGVRQRGAGPPPRRGSSSKPPEPQNRSAGRGQQDERRGGRPPRPGSGGRWTGGGPRGGEADRGSSDRGAGRPSRTGPGGGRPARPGSSSGRPGGRSAGPNKPGGRGQKNPGSGNRPLKRGGGPPPRKRS